MRLPGRHDARFLGNIPSVETGNEGKRNRKRNRFHLPEWRFCWQISWRKETKWKRQKETKPCFLRPFRFLFFRCFQQTRQPGFGLPVLHRQRCLTGEISRLAPVDHSFNCSRCNAAAQPAQARCLQCGAEFKP